MASIRTHDGLADSLRMPQLLNLMVTKTLSKVSVCAQTHIANNLHLCQRAVRFRQIVKILRQDQIIPRMSRQANPYDSASCESYEDAQTGGNYCRRLSGSHAHRRLRSQ